MDTALSRCLAQLAKEGCVAIIHTSEIVLHKQDTDAFRSFEHIECRLKTPIDIVQRRTGLIKIRYRQIRAIDAVSFRQDIPLFRSDDLVAKVADATGLLHHCW